MKAQLDNEFAAFVGIDWADRKHDLCLQVAHTEQREFAVLAHRPDAIDQWAARSENAFRVGRWRCASSLPEGPLVYALQKHDFLILFPVNPATLARYRQAFTPSHAKDDPTDAEYQLELLVRHRDKLQALKAQSAPMRALTSLVEERRLLVDETERITNRLTNTLKQYYPQAVQWFEAKNTILFCDFLSRWPTLKQVKHARKAMLEAFFWEHHVRHPKVVEERLAGIKPPRRSRKTLRSSRRTGSWREPSSINCAPFFRP